MKKSTNIVLAIIAAIVLIVILFIILITKGGPLKNILVNKSLNTSEKLIDMFKSLVVLQGKKSEGKIIIWIILLIFCIILLMFLLPKVYVPFNNTTEKAIETLNSSVSNII